MDIPQAPNDGHQPHAQTTRENLATGPAAAKRTRSESEKDPRQLNRTPAICTRTKPPKWLRGFENQTTANDPSGSAAPQVSQKFGITLTVLLGSPEE